MLSSLCPNKGKVRREHLHREASTYGSFETDQLLHRDSFPRKPFHTKHLLHREPFAQSTLYTQALLRREAFTAGKLLHAEIFTEIGLAEIFATQSSRGIKAFRHIVGGSTETHQAPRSAPATLSSRHLSVQMPGKTLLTCCHAEQTRRQSVQTRPGTLQTGTKCSAYHIKASA